MRERGMNNQVTRNGRPEQYGPAQLARLLGLPAPTPEQAAVIAAPLRPLAVIALSLIHI